MSTTETLRAQAAPSPYPPPPIAKNTPKPPEPAARETNLTQQLAEQLTSHLTRIRQSLDNRPAPKESDKIGSTLDLRA